MTLIITRNSNNTGTAVDPNEISIQFKELSVLSKYLPYTESLIIDRLLKIVDDLNNPQILKHEVLKLAIAPRRRYYDVYEEREVS